MTQQMSLDSIAAECGTIEESQIDDDNDRVQQGDADGLPDQSGDYEVETGW